jgi:TRAP-type C4-dicarboxylate transport system permease large subunit
MLCGVTWYLARKRGYPRMPKAGWGERWRTFRESLWGLMLVVTIAVLPWFGTMVLFLAIVTYWPGLSMWPPRALGMM